MVRLSEVFTLRENPGPISKDDGVCDLCQDDESQPTIEFTPKQGKVRETLEICMRCLEEMQQLSAGAAAQGIKQGL